MVRHIKISSQLLAAVAVVCWLIFPGLARRLWRDRAGAAAVYMGVTLALVVGVGALVIDLGRLYTLGTEQENAADSAALACAVELDGASGAIASGTLAAQGALVNNSQTFALGGHDVAIEQIRFLKDLPSDDVVIDDSYVTTLDSEARFCEVTVETRAIANLLIGVVGGAPTSSTAAVAVAGYTRMMCNVPPLAVCNPDEYRVGMGAGFDLEYWGGKQILAKAAGGNTAWTPGDFALLDGPWGQSAKAIAYLLATADPNTPCFGAFVDVKPGQTEGARQALNTRFDMYANPFFGSGKAKRDPEFRPSRDVTKGRVGVDGTVETCTDGSIDPDTGEFIPGTCTYKEVCVYLEPGDTDPITGDIIPETDPGTGLPFAKGLPRDSNLPPDKNAITNTNRFGNGKWDRDTYWAVNHPGKPTPPAYGQMSRYEAYEYELQNSIPDNSATGGEDGNPMCYRNTTEPPSDDPDRRILYLAIINCLEHGPITGNSAGPIPVEELIKVFLTEPVGDPPDSDIWLEIVGPGGAEDNVFHDVVQLYR